VEVKIGIAESARELLVSSDQSPEEVAKLVDEAITSDGGLLRLTDDRGRKFVIRGERIAYVEIAPEEARKVGFAIQ
jgi:hypothetical protein